MDKVSIIVPIYNTAKYLPKCIDSLLAQKYANIEIILINDGSGDESDSICKQYIKKDKRIKYYYKKNGGVSSARNMGLEKATGEYIVFVDSDDYVTSKYVTELTKYIEKCDMVTSLTTKKNSPEKSRTLSKDEMLKYLFNSNYIGYQGYPWNKLFKKEIIDDNNLSFSEEIHYNEDRLFVFHYLQFCTKIYYTEENNYYYIERTNSAMSNKKYDSKSKTEFDAFRIMLKEAKMNNLSQEIINTIEMQYYKRVSEMSRIYKSKVLSKEYKFKALLLAIFKRKIGTKNKLRMIKYFIKKYH